MNEKKVVTVIVEGPSDENAIGGILKEFFSSEEVQFAVVHGDITSNYSTTKENVVSKVGALIETIKSKYGYNWGDFVKIIHIADTDGAFTKNCIKEAEVENIQYYEDHMEYFDIEEVEKRNAHKSEIMFKLYTTGKIRNIPYRLYFNSCNLEHVLYNELKDFSDDEKEKAKSDMGRMLDYIDKLNELDTTGVEPMSHVFPVHNVFREDVVTNGDGHDATLANAPAQKDDAFKVPKTVE